MAAIQPAAIRTAIALRLVTSGVGYVPPFVRESAEPWEFIRAASHSPVHLEFAVGIPATVPEGGTGGRQKADVGVLAHADVKVGFWYQLGPKDRVTSMTTALGVQANTRNWLMVKGWTADFHVLWDGQEHAAGLDGWVFFTQSFRTISLMPLS